eukprot:3938377-Rhodomonas_salina.5
MGYGMRGTEIAYGAPDVSGTPCQQYTLGPLSAYALPTRCPVTLRPVLTMVGSDGVNITVPSPTFLRACYAMSGTVIVSPLPPYALAMLCPISDEGEMFCPPFQIDNRTESLVLPLYCNSLRACYALSGTGITSGTELARRATSNPGAAQDSPPIAVQSSTDNVESAGQLR